MKLRSFIRLAMACFGVSLFVVRASASTEASAATIYSCEVGGVVTYSDRPCGGAARVHELDMTRLNTVEPPVVTKPKPPAMRRAPATKEPSAAAEAAEKRKRAERCARLQASLKEIRSKMRAGYSASEGERLRERTAKLQAQLRASQCR